MKLTWGKLLNLFFTIVHSNNRQRQFIWGSLCYWWRIPPASCNLEEWWDFSAILNNYVAYINKYYNQGATIVVYNGYPENLPVKSIKPAESQRRAKRHTAPEVIFNELMTATNAPRAVSIQRWEQRKAYSRSPTQKNPALFDTVYKLCELIEYKKIKDFARRATRNFG